LNDGFQPPQFFQRLAGDGALVSAFMGDSNGSTKSALRGATGRRPPGVSTA